MRAGRHTERHADDSKTAARGASSGPHRSSRADVNALRQERGITFEEAYDEIAIPDWVRQYTGARIDLENQVISKAKSIARGRRGVTREAHHVVRDFSTLPDLVKHAKSDLGATHVSGQGAETRIYFPLGSGQYEEATVWQKGNYWHATGPGARQRVAKPPRDAKPITQQGRGGRRRLAEPSCSRSSTSIPENR